VRLAPQKSITIARDAIPAARRPHARRT